MKHLRTTHITQRRLTQSSVTAMLALSFGIAAHAQTPIVSYNFNDSASGNTTASNGSYALSDSILTFYPNPGYVAASTSNSPGNLHGAAGSGVSGAAADLAFDNSASTSMGTLNSNPTSGSALTTSSVSGLNTPLTSFTVTGWFKTNTGVLFNNSARLLDAGSVTILGTNGGEIQFLVNGQRCYCNNSYNQVNVWTFFAITYDSTVSNANGTKGAATFYVGYRPQDFAAGSYPGFNPNSPAVVSIGGENSGGSGGSVTFTTGAGGPAASPGTPVFTGLLDIGNSVTAGAGNNRGFAGLMDDVAIYGSALTQTQIDQIRQANLAPPITGNVALQGVNSPNLAQPMVFTLTPTNGTLGVVTTQNVTPNATDGSYTLSGLLPGTYTVGVKGAKWLQQNQINTITTTSAAPSLGFNLLGGDLTGDNRINIQDYNLFSAAYGSTPASANWNPLADLNCDGKVSILDYNIFSSNYGKFGDTNP